MKEQMESGQAAAAYMPQDEIRAAGRGGRARGGTARGAAAGRCGRGSGAQSV